MASELKYCKTLQICQCMDANILVRILYLLYNINFSELIMILQLLDVLELIIYLSNNLIFHQRKMEYRIQLCWVRKVITTRRGSQESSLLIKCSFQGQLLSDGRKSNPHIYGQLLYGKGAKNIRGGRTVSSINSVGKTRQKICKRQS